VQHLADEMFAWVRKWAKRAQGRPGGPEAAQAVRAGRLQLAAPDMIVMR
jgi:hypothetical protein